MDPIGLIMRALETGNSPDIGIDAMAPDDDRNLYDELLDLVSARLLGAGQPTLLENYMAMPELYDSALAEVLEESGAGADGQLIDLAQSYMSFADPRRAARGGYTVDIDDDTEGFV